MAGRRSIYLVRERGWSGNLLGASMRRALKIVMLEMSKLPGPKLKLVADARVVKRAGLMGEIW